jgi:hypothetical protein
LLRAFGHDASELRRGPSSVSVEAAEASAERQNAVLEYGN